MRTVERLHLLPLVTLLAVLLAGCESRQQRRERDARELTRQITGNAQASDRAPDAPSGGSAIMPAPADGPSLVDQLLAFPVTGSQSSGPVVAQAHACTRSGLNVLCVVTMQARDIDVNIDDTEQTATDNHGNTLDVSFQVGRERPTSNSGVLVAGVPTPTQAWIEGVPLSADTISRLNLGVYVVPVGQNGYREAFVFRGLPIIQQR